MKNIGHKIWVAAVALAVIAAVAAAFLFKDNIPYTFAENQSDFTSSWYCTDQSKAEFPYHLKEDTANELHAVLPRVDDNTVLAVKCNFETITAAIDGKEIYFASAAQLGKLKTVVGNYRVFIPLSEEYTNREIVLTIVPRSSAYIVSVKDITLGTKEAYAVSEFVSNLFSLLIGIVLIMMAAISLGVWLCCKLSKNMRLYANLDDFLYITLTSVTLGVWIISYVHIFEILNGKMAFTGIINYLAFMLIPFSVSGLLMALSNKRNKALNIIHRVIGAVFVLQMLLFMCGVCDLSNSLMVSHGLCIFVMGEIVYLLIKGITSKTKTAKKLAIPAYAVIIVLCAAAIVMYIIDKAWMIYVCIALCVLMATLFAESAAGLYWLVKENIKTEEFRRHAFTDALTQLGSRYSYETQIAKLNGSPLPGNFTVVVMDLNKLKVTNDTYGHAAGDEIIKGAADCIRDVFADMGTCYRTGGDEFVVFTRCGEAALTEAFERFDTAVNSWHGSIIDSFRVSYGRVSAGEYPDCSVEELIKIADDLMYEVKRGYYENKKI